MRIFVVGCLLCMGLWAKSYIISPLPLPKQEIINLEAGSCDKRCLNKLYEEGLYFSFIGRFQDEQDPELRAKLTLALQELAILDIPNASNGNMAKVKLALLMPKKVIGRYFSESIDIILSYLMTRGADFSFEVFNTDTEDTQAIQQAYQRAIDAQSDFVIGIFTTKGARELANNIKISVPVYLPTINIHQVGSAKIPKNLYFGGVDYESQIELIANLAQGEKVVAYNDNSPMGQYLGSLLRSKNAKIVYEQSVDSTTAKRFSSVMGQQKSYIRSNVVVFNTSGARTGLILSQMLIGDAKPKKMFSTQVNYDSALLNSVQYSGREELYVVNVISGINPRLLEYASLLGRDLKYNWVSYSTAIGVELLLGAQLSEQERFFSERFLDNQVNYINKIYKFSGKSFDEYR
ncbi:hypothetical protein [uncultured Helicobacter sp.]|uniref:hypothetical protein n=1 Tax=uncultured Helicobacter sp. TaxID=175537 RepID=UPI001C399DB3|nr:hypothetical protein [Candidatus Helicobacter avicola]